MQLMFGHRFIYIIVSIFTPGYSHGHISLQLNALFALMHDVHMILRPAYCVDGNEAYVCTKQLLVLYRNLVPIITVTASITGCPRLV